MDSTPNWQKPVLSVCSLHARETHRMMLVVVFILVSHFERNVQKVMLLCELCVMYVVFHLVSYFEECSSAAFLFLVNFQTTKNKKQKKKVKNK
jgi:hypothetical protein